MSAGEKKPLATIRPIAENIREQLAPHCERVEIAGSIRRGCRWVGDIEMVAIPKPYDVGLFSSGVAEVVEKWEKVRGELPGCKYTQRLLPGGIKLDLFFATPQNWGLIYAIRTGSADFAGKVLLHGLRVRGMHCENGRVIREADGEEIWTLEEGDVFRLAGVPWVRPEDRSGVLA